jgi:exonuclease III
MILGDFNDDISGTDSLANVFFSFIEDSINYSFADMTIASGNEKFWSYPSWPSHIDHILITSELSDRVEDTQVLTLDVCDERYSSYISDHRPVMIQLR